MMIDEQNDSLYLSKMAEKMRNRINLTMKQAVCLILG